MIISCDDFDDDNIDFSNSLDPYVEFNSPAAVNAWAGQPVSLPVVIRVVEQNDLSVSYKIEGDLNLDSTLVIAANQFSNTLSLPSLGDGIIGQAVASLSGVDNPNFSVGRGNPDLGISVTQVSITWRGPTANDFEFTTPFQTELNGNVGTNDIFPSGASTFLLLTGTTNGNLSLNMNGGFVYVPNDSFSGADSFTYQLCLATPNDNVCDSASITIIVEEED